MPARAAEEPHRGRSQSVRFQAITGNGIHDNYGRAEKVPGGKVKEKRAGSITAVA